ncbi:hypothetical protein PHMEG_0004470 [Phytophthora megakarya]|uniref:Uncharacterized protein n=1 Tax=Phytophthora megakarya TaxID=4795 RepID=A0A225WTQ3_9STRA|nr:hypothetical protein PHMEG_0004470 [Phytophthora megakarya]
MSKPPSMLLRPSAGPATGVLYEPDAPRRRPSDNYLQVNTRLSASSGRMASPSPSLRTGSPGRVLRPPTPSIQQTKIVPPSTCVKLITPHMQFSTDLVRALLRKVQHKYAQCRLPSVSGNSQKHAAQLLYVANNLADSELLYRENELFSAHERALEAVWPHALIRVSYKVSSYSNPAGDDTNVFNMASFVLPHKQQQNVSRGSKVGTRSSSASPPSEIKKRKDQNKTKPLLTSNKYLTFDEAAGGFQRFVLSLPSSPSFTSQTVPMTPGSNAIPHVLSLREWLSNASRVFDAVRKASCFTAEYTSSRDHH